MKKIYTTIAFALAGLITLHSQTTTFNYTGAMQTYVVPAGVTSIAVDAYGAEGGGNASIGAGGGLGGRVQATMAVTPGQTLNIFVGGMGDPTGTAGYNGGGLGVNGSVANPGSGGGGGTDIRIGGTTFNDRVLVAGGGGGGTENGGASMGGAGGGLVGGTGGLGGDPWACFPTAATGGTQSAGGLGGVSSGCAWNGSNGAFGVGGNTYMVYRSAGGGGGWYGGGGAHNGHSGGGGSSYTSGICTAVTHTQGAHNGNGMLAITVLSIPAAALNFDGIDDQINMGTSMNAVLDNASQITVEAWVYPTSNTGSGCIIGNYSTPNFEMQFLLRREYDMYDFWIDRGSGFIQCQTPVNAVVLNTWQHIVGVWDGATSKIYVDGVLMTTVNTPGGTLTTTTNSVEIGWNSISSEIFMGSMDEIRVWTRALCSAEIANNSNCEISATGNGLLANYHFNQGTASGANAGVTTLTDASGNGYNGTLTSFALTGATSNWIAPGAVTSGSSCSAFNNSVSATSTHTDVLCNGATTGSATASATGTGPFNYSWAPSGGNAATANNLAAGTYTCTVTNDCGGSATTIVTITEPTAISVSEVHTNITCFGGSDGSVTLTVSGGTPGYTFDWNSGMYNTQNLTGISAGTYTGTITDANGCTSSGTVTLTEPPAITSSVSSTNITCNGANDGTITLTVSGGTPGYTFNWNSGMYTTQNLTNLSPGTYTGVITDANGCTDGGTVTITEPAVLVIAPVASGDPTTCGGTDGMIDISVSGGTLPYNFDWNAGTYSTEDLTGVGAGTYSLIVTDANGCPAMFSIDLFDPAAPTVTLSLTQNTICLNDAPMTLSGGSPAGGTYSGTGVSAGVFNPMTAGTGTYTITYNYTDPNTQCSANATSTITVSPCTGIVDPSATQNAFTVMPNPNNGTFTLFVNGNDEADVIIYNSIGQLMNAQKVQPHVQQQLTIEISGVYFISVIAADGSRSTQRVVVNR